MALYSDIDPTLPGYDISDYEVSEKEKETSLNYLMTMTDRVISRNVNENSDRRLRMFKMRDFYDGIRDAREFAYLEDNYGVGNPSSIRFTPLIRNRIDTLIGLLSTLEFDYSVSVVDSKSLFQAEQDRTTAMLGELYKGIAASAQAQQEGKKATPMDKLMEEAETESARKWRNQYIESATNFVEDMKECPIIDLKRLRELIFEDLSVVSEGIYRVKRTEIGRKPKPEALLPENCYYTLRRDQSTINEASEFVYIHYMSKRDVLQKWGHLMTMDEKKELLKMDSLKLSSTLGSYMTPSQHNTGDREETDSKRKSAIDRYRLFGEDSDVLRVYEVEWKANNEYGIDTKELKNNLLVTGPTNLQNKRNRQDLYRSVRINDSVYLDMGKDESATRFDIDPDTVYLTFNGVLHSGRGGEPYSILWKCKDIQDMHDILLFQRDNLMANSGVRGINLEFSKIPEFLDAGNEMNRVMKSLALIKQGVNLTDGTQEGADGPNGSHGTFDMTVNGESLSAINETIKSLDDEATKITGVTPQMMGAIEQRAAVTNVKTGINNASLTLKKLFDEHDRVMKFLLTDCINAAQATMKDGYTGSYRNGTEIFTIIPKYFSFTNYRMHVVNTSQEKAKLDEAKSLVHEAMATGSVPWDIGLKVVMMDNPSEIIELAAEIAAKQSSLKAQLDQATQENDQLKKDLDKAKADLAKVDQASNDIEEKKVQATIQRDQGSLQIQQGELDRKRAADQTNSDLKDRELDLEEQQIYLSNSIEKQKVRQDIVP